MGAEHEAHMATCSHCRKPHTAKSMKRNVFLIPKRSRPLSRKKFCSIKCLTDHLAKVDPDWKVVGESWSEGNGSLTVHSISVAGTELVQARIRYRG